MTKKTWLALCVLNLGIGLGWWSLYRSTILSFQVAPKVVSTSGYRAEAPTQVMIAKLNLELPLVPSSIVNGTWETTQAGASYLADSARPGEPGNIIVYAHNLTRLFGRLKEVKPGDTISMKVTDGSVHEYRVETTQIVKPDAIEAVLPTKTEVLTLYTCTGWLDSQRLIVRAVPTQTISAGK